MKAARPSRSYSVQRLQMVHLQRPKVVGILMGLQGEFTKHCCFLCLWNTLATKEHNIRRDWSVRKSHLTGVANIKNVPLVQGWANCGPHANKITLIYSSNNCWFLMLYQIKNANQLE